MWNLFRRKKAKDFIKTALSDETEKRVRILFDPSEFSAVEELLINKCGNNLFGYEESDEKGLERVRFSVLKISGGDFDKLKEAVDLANLDTRDVFIPRVYTIFIRIVTGILNFLVTAESQLKCV